MKIKARLNIKCASKNYVKKKKREKKDTYQIIAVFWIGQGHG